MNREEIELEKKRINDKASIIEDRIDNLSHEIEELKEQWYQLKVKYFNVCAQEQSLNVSVD